MIPPPNNACYPNTFISHLKSLSERISEVKTFQATSPVNLAGTFIHHVRKTFTGSSSVNWQKQGIG